MQNLSREDIKAKYFTNGKYNAHKSEMIRVERKMNMNMKNIKDERSEIVKIFTVQSAPFHYR